MARSAFRVAIHTPMDEHPSCCFCLLLRRAADDPAGADLAYVFTLNCHGLYNPPRLREARPCLASVQGENWGKSPK